MADLFDTFILSLGSDEPPPFAAAMLRGDRDAAHDLAQSQGPRGR